MFLCRFLRSQISDNAKKRFQLIPVFLAFSPAEHILMTESHAFATVKMTVGAIKPAVYNTETQSHKTGLGLIKKF